MTRSCWVVAIGLTISSTAAAHSPPPLFPLPAAEVSRLRGILDEGLASGDISPDQHRTGVDWVAASPCDAVEVDSTAERQASLALAIAKQPDFDSVEIFREFRLDGWHVVYSTWGISDPVFGFYSADPRSGALPLAFWNGAAAIFETAEMIEWVEATVPGIPTPLAECFSWYVTLSRD